MKSKRLKAVAVTAVVLLMAMVSLAVLRPRAKQTEKPAIPVKLAVVEMNSAGSESRSSDKSNASLELKSSFTSSGRPA